MLRAALCALGAGLAFSASAQNYVGIGFGGGHAALPSLDAAYLGTPVTATPDKTDNTSFKLYAGHQFTHNWGVEAGVAELGDGYSARTTVSGAPAGSPSGSLATRYVAVTGTLPVGKRLSLFGKIGLAANEFSSNTACVASFPPKCVLPRSGSHSDTLVGVGVQYQPAQRPGLRLEYEDYGKMSGDDVWGSGGSGAIKGSSWYLAVQLMF